MQDHTPDPIIVGHRGFPSCYPENSLAGINTALQLGLKAIEIDIQLTRDGIPIVFHDTRFDRVANFCGSIFNFSYRELCNISIHEPDRFLLKYYPTPILSLENFCRGFFSYDFELFIEIKQESYSVLNKKNYADSVIKASNLFSKNRIIISYDDDILAYIKNKYKLPVGIILNEYSPESYLSVKELKPNFVICNFKKLRNVERLWEINGSWFIYDIVNQQDAIFWKQLGVKYLESWDPIRLMQSLNKENVIVQ